MSSIAKAEPQVSPESVRTELARLLESRELRNSTQLRKLLQFLVEETLAGRAENLKEYHVGLSVFLRGKDFDPRLDSIVRVQASLLRKKLESHYLADGSAEALRFDLPRGSYVPEWSLAPASAPPREEAILPPSPPQASRRWLLQGAATGGIGALAGAGAMYLFKRQPPPPLATGAIWGKFLQPGVPTIVSFGVPLFYAGPDGLYFRDVRINSPEEFAKGQLQAFAERSKIVIRPQEDVYTGVGESVGVQVISRFLEQQGVAISVANSHYLGPPDLVGKNLVVVASMRFQTLLGALRLPHAFDFDPGDEGVLRNVRPVAGEPAIFRAEAKPGLNVSFARVTLWPSATAERSILYLSGRETWATQAAAQFVVDPDEQRRLQQKLDADPKSGPRGQKGPFWEVLLRAEGENNRVRRTQYVTHRYLEVPLPLRFR